jgi:hypothetical protein
MLKRDREKLQKRQYQASVMREKARVAKIRREDPNYIKKAGKGSIVRNERALLLRRARADRKSSTGWDESKHPRDHGKWTNK